MLSRRSYCVLRGTKIVVHLKDTDVAEAYKDVVARFLGEERPMRFVEAEKPGFFKRLFGGR